jgi:hypothetical protein
MSTRVKINDHDAQALRSRPVAKGKGASKQREAERELEKDVKVIRTKKSESQTQTVGGGSLRGVMEETMARVYGEIFSGMSTHDEDGIVDREIKEETYILGLTMAVGNENDLPRMGLSMREDAKASANMKSCKECADA